MFQPRPSGRGLFKSGLASTLYPFFLSAGLAHHSHNLFLQVAVDLGLPGLIAYLALGLLGFFFCAWQAYRALRLPQWLCGSDGQPRQAPPWLASLALGLLGSLTALCVHGLVDAATWSNKLAFLLWFTFGLSAALWRWVAS